MRLSVIVPAALLGLLPLACGGSEPDPNDPSRAQNQYGGGQYQPQRPRRSGRRRWFRDPGCPRDGRSRDARDGGYRRVPGPGNAS